MIKRSFLIFLFISTLIVGSHVFADSENPVLTGPSQNIEIAETKDYATDVLQDPWDMNNREDVNTDLSSSSRSEFKNVSIKNGIWTGTINNNKDADGNGEFWLLWGGHTGDYAGSRDGINKPIDTSVYKTFSIKASIDKPGNKYPGGRIRSHWIFSQDLKSTKSILDLADLAYDGQWAIYQFKVPDIKKKVVGLKIVFESGTRTIVKVDWARLTSDPPSPTSIEWLPKDKVGEFFTTSIFGDNDNAGNDGFVLDSYILGVKNDPGVFNLEGLSAGSYYFNVGRYGNYANDRSYKYSNYSSKVSINKAPSVKVIEPDEAGGADWAKTVLKNPWDMKSSKDVNQAANISKVKLEKVFFQELMAVMILILD